MSDITELGKNPIRQDMPSGEDVRYDPVYEDLLSEIEKLASPTSQGGIDWNKIAKLAEELLREKTKNILIASYLFVAVLNSRGAEMLPPLMIMYRGIIENFWDSLFPPKKRKKARINALDWWLEKLLTAIDSFPEDTALEEEDKISLMAELQGLDDFLAQNLDDAPLLHQLRNRLDAIAIIPKPEPEIPAPEKSEEASAPETETAALAENGGEAARTESEKDSAPEKAPEAESAEIKKAPPPPAPPKTAPAENAEDLQGEPEQILRRGLDMLRRAATLLMQKNPSDPTSYRLNRISAWLNIKTLPPARKGETHLPPPMDQEKEALRGLYERGNFSALLESAESRVGQYLFWTDLSRYVAESLMHLGHTAAQKVVEEETAAYVKRLPGIENLTFSDGTAFADEETKEWLREIVSSAEGSAGSAGNTGDEEQVRIAEIYKDAMSLAKEGKAAEALELLQKHSKETNSRRAGLLWRIHFVRLLLYLKKPRLAIPHAEELLAELDRYAIEIWDPDLALNALIQIYETFRPRNGEPENEENGKQCSEAVLDRISRLHPAAALRLT